MNEEVIKINLSLWKLNQVNMIQEVLHSLSILQRKGDLKFKIKVTEDKPSWEY